MLAATIINLKQIAMKNLLHRTILLFLTSLVSLQLFAQDKKVDVDISLNKDNNSNWYQQPWVWVVGGAVFILLIIVLARGGGKKE